MSSSLLAEEESNEGEAWYPGTAVTIRSVSWHKSRKGSKALGGPVPAAVEAEAEEEDEAGGSPA